jgi:hypothetical protein
MRFKGLRLAKAARYILLRDYGSQGNWRARSETGLYALKPGPRKKFCVAEVFFAEGPWRHGPKLAAYFTHKEMDESAPSEDASASHHYGCEREAAEIHLNRNFARCG